MLGETEANLNKFQSELSESHLRFRTGTCPFFDSEVCLNQPVHNYNGS